jgi:hypothetical protein
VNGNITLALIAVRLGRIIARTDGAAELMRWNVAGVQREALVVALVQQMKLPLVFVFHGHGGKMRLPSIASGAMKAGPIRCFKQASSSHDLYS